MCRDHAPFYEVWSGLIQFSFFDHILPSLGRDFSMEFGSRPYSAFTVEIFFNNMQLEVSLKSIIIFHLYLHVNLKKIITFEYERHLGDFSSGMHSSWMYLS
jgi:hypothetical protein